MANHRIIVEDRQKSFTHRDSVPVVLSFDVEEHHSIEAAAGLQVGADLARQYHDRMTATTEWILELLQERQVRATFFIVGLIAETNPRLIRSIHDAGHEVASHGWDHRRLHLMGPEAFREDLRKSRQALQQAAGVKVLGFRAPTFSLVRQTAWAVDVLAEEEFLYDSSIYPVYHDRYGVPDAPRGPFLVRGASVGNSRDSPGDTPYWRREHSRGRWRILPADAFSGHELGSFVLRREPACTATMLYFHPWEFDPEQPPLPLSPLNRFRTYTGISRTRGRLSRLLTGGSFLTAAELAGRLDEQRESLPHFQLSP